MLKIAHLLVLLIFISSCSILNSSRTKSDSAFKGLNKKEAEEIQKENYKKYTNSYHYKMQLEVDRRHKEELRRSKFAHKSKVQ
jgi:hypothetical protein